MKLDFQYKLILLGIHSKCLTSAEREESTLAKIKCSSGNRKLLQGRRSELSQMFDGCRKLAKY